MATARTARPSIVHNTCFVRKKYGCWKRSSATTADALYTITTLAHTSSSVAVKRTLSDFSLLAITDVPPNARKHLCRDCRTRDPSIR